jgi:hypothetical protein
MALIKIIKVSTTRGVAALPLKRNIVLRFMKGGGATPCRIRLPFMTVLVLRFITRSFWSCNSSERSEWKRIFSNRNVKDDIPHWGKNIQTESSIGAIGDDILWDNRIGWMHEIVGEIILTWHRKLTTLSWVLDRS